MVGKWQRQRIPDGHTEVGRRKRGRKPAHSRQNDSA